MKRDILKNVNKIGVHFDPIPFSYKAGSYGREKPDAVIEALEPFEPEGFHMYRLPGTGPELNSAKIEAKANKHLNVLHKRLGYIKVSVLEKI